MEELGNAPLGAVRPWSALKDLAQGQRYVERRGTNVFGSCGKTSGSYVELQRLRLNKLVAFNREGGLQDLL